VRNVGVVLVVFLGLLLETSGAHAQAPTNNPTFAGGIVGTNISIRTADEAEDGYVVSNPFYYTGPSTYTQEPAFIGPLPPDLELWQLWEYNLPLHSAVIYGPSMLINLPNAATIYLYDESTGEFIGSAGFAAGSYVTISGGTETDYLEVYINFDSGVDDVVLELIYPW
jgi:hypothetical protein